MRKLLIIAVAVASASFVAARQTPNPPPLEDPAVTIQKAIEAHGGAAVLNKYPAGSIKCRGVMCAGASNILFCSSFVYNMPDRVRNTVTLTIPNPSAVPIPGLKQSVTYVQNGDKVVMIVGGQSQPVTGAELERYRNGIYVQNLIRLTPLLDTKIYKLSSVGETTICDRRARGVKVSVDGRRDVVMYFDRVTYLLVKIERYGHDHAGQEAPLEEFYTHYQEVRGVMHPTKTATMLRGKKYIESETIEFMPLATVDPIEFAIP